ncbi:hypothetical protein [Parasedimentitalea psychrophila]|uniref:Uncharacterized protein n=1 Tax=Parasedimentitalea psychrophila TaxID=2997337 RepID=A0A9Y2KYX3_9RHOB|nr:hypothetical protein [Parasedimentitalea psychrophila]WIY24307.1 hypothetical protein QPJ95_17140 [Parasedimentitalea psychrophila]
MKPGFALSLSPDGISLLHRAAGGWRLVGRVALDSSDLDTALEDLRAKAQQLAAGVMFCKLIIPNSQIRYLTLETGLVDGDTRMDMARTALDGATPYPVSELAFDLSQDGVLTHVAAVAIETLEEAESFANTHGFGPTSFVAAPGEEAFLGEPFFGTTRAIRGTVVEPDGIAVVNIGPADIPGPPSASDLDPDPDPTPAAEGQPDKADGTPQPPEPKASGHLVEPDQMDQAEASNTRPIPTPGFSSRRRKASGRAPVLDGANRAPSATDSHDTISAPALLQSAPSLLQSAPSDHPRPDETTIRVAAALQEPSKSLGAATAAQVSAPSVPGHDQDPTPASAADDTGLSIRQQTAAAQDLPPQSRQPTSQAKSEAATGAKSKATAKPAPPPSASGNHRTLAANHHSWDRCWLPPCCCSWLRSRPGLSLPKPHGFLQARNLPPKRRFRPPCQSTPLWRHNRPPRPLFCRSRRSRLVKINGLKFFNLRSVPDRTT